MYDPAGQVHVVFAPELEVVNPDLHVYVHTVSVVGVHDVDVTVPFVGAAAHAEHGKHGSNPVDE
jgi:hypothetical protein